MSELTDTRNANPGAHIFMGLTGIAAMAGAIKVTGDPYAAFYALVSGLISGVIVALAWAILGAIAYWPLRAPKLEQRVARKMAPFVMAAGILLSAPSDIGVKLAAFWLICDAISHAIFKSWTGVWLWDSKP